MLDRRLVETLPPLGGLAAGLALALAGLMLCVTAQTGDLRSLETLPLVVPTGIGVAMAVLGAFLLAQHSSELARWLAERRQVSRYFDALAEPMFVTDLDGALRSCNAVAGRPAPGTAFLEPWVADARAVQYRLIVAARARGFAAEDNFPEPRIAVVRAGSDTLIWRVDPRIVPNLGAPDFGSAEIPWLRLDRQGAILRANAAAAPGPVPPERLEDILTDPPLRPGGVHVLASSGRAVRALVISDTPEHRDVLLIELNGAEISGLVPDHFLEELPVALARLEPTGQLTYANRAARQLLGERAEPGVNIMALIEGMGRPIAERLQDTNKGRALGRSEVARSTVGGADVFLQVAFTRALLDGVPSLLAVISDATELKTLEAQFVQSQKMQAVGQLAGGVAHDFNNLLTAINGHCDLLLMRHDVADVEHGDLMQIRQNANRAAALVRQLLAFSRKQTLRPTVINLQDTLGELTHLLNRLLTERVTLRIKYGAELAPVRVDERQLEQVIMNLVVNARDAMPHGGEVRITTRNVHLERDLHRDRAVVLQGDYVVIEVIDSGTGIPENKLNKIFEPFYTTKQVGEGTGLGLSTAYGIIKQTGGFIFADSSPGQGATFTIYLPAYDAIEIAAPAEPEVRQTPDLTGRGLVLLVEDEDPVRSVAARALRLRGYTVVEAASGEEALELLEDGELHVDLMLSDVIMPGLDGPAWVREAHRARPETKVLFMSGYAEDAFVGGDSGIANAAFMPKPFTLNELTQRVKDHMEA